jgi:DNA-binding NarL/FixJ family response regulator
VPDLLSADEWSRLVGALGLVGREVDVLRAAFYDERVSAIAKRLKLKRDTIHTYRKRLFLKLDVRSMTQVLAYAFAVYVEQPQTRRDSSSDYAP